MLVVKHQSSLNNNFASSSSYMICHIDQCDLNLIYNAHVLIGCHLMFGVSESIFYFAHLETSLQSQIGGKGGGGVELKLLQGAYNL